MEDGANKSGDLELEANVTSWTNSTVDWQEEKDIFSFFLITFILGGYLLLLLSCIIQPENYWERIKELFKQFTDLGSWRSDCFRNFLTLSVILFCIIIPIGGYIILVKWVLTFLMKLMQRAKHFCYEFLNLIYLFCLDLTGHPKKAWDLFLFVFFNILVNGSDVILDILNAEELGKLNIF